MTFHAHIETSSTDCDGRLDRDYVSEARPDEDNYDFKARTLSALVSWSYPNRVEFRGDDSDEIEVSYQHDEGSFYGEARFCGNPECNPNKSGQRDHYAEAMGY